MRNTTQTYSGIEFDAFNPTEEMIDIRDIAHGLANTCRFHGQCKFFYSVGQHCIQGYKYLKTIVNLWDDKERSKEYKNKVLLTWLLHDATEAYILDMPTPIKNKLREYKRLESNLNKVIVNKFRLLDPAPFAIKHMDSVMLSTEYYKLFKGVYKYMDNFIQTKYHKFESAIEPKIYIYKQPRIYVKYKFLKIFNKLYESQNCT